MGCHQTEVNTPKLVIVALVSVLWVPFSLFADETASYPVAGANPDQRPENAPVISQGPHKDQNWYVNALHGVDAPYPVSLLFLEDQGNWFTPFTRRGMTGRYDIRDWHTK